MLQWDASILQHANPQQGKAASWILQREQCWGLCTHHAPEHDSRHVSSCGHCGIAPVAFCNVTVPHSACSIHRQGPMARTTFQSVTHASAELEPVFTTSPNRSAPSCFLDTPRHACNAAHRLQERTVAESYKQVGARTGNATSAHARGQSGWSIGD